MKKLLLVFVTVLITVSGYAQKTADIGVWGGSLTTVHGDMDEDKPFQSFNLNFGAYFRYNFNARVGLRAMLLTGKFAGEGEVEGVPWNFDKSVQDLSLQAEINFLKYVLGAKKMPWTPYVTAGIGLAYFPYNFRSAEMAAINPAYPEVVSGTGDYKENKLVPTIPFGIGVKYTIGERLGIGVEYQMRKYLSDKVDDLFDPLAHVSSTTGEVITYSTENHNTDWAGYLGLHITYKIYLGKKICPAYESKN